ncbi:unnamed protein product [Hapterophycus canaliculatus]
MSLSTALSFVLVGACWGCTTPFIKDGTAADPEQDASGARKLHGGDKSGRATKTKATRVGEILSPLRSLASVKAAVPFLLNQSGSTIFYYLLSSQDISTAVPVCNALSLVFTATTATWLGEKMDHPLKTVSGILLVMGGLAVCVASKEAGREHIARTVGGGNTSVLRPQDSRPTSVGGHFRKTNVR